MVLKIGVLWYYVMLQMIVNYFISVSISEMFKPLQNSVFLTESIINLFLKKCGWKRGPKTNFINIFYLSKCF